MKHVHLTYAGDMVYPSTLPKAVPAGLALVHNHVKPAKRQGTRGFRFWLQRPNDRLEPCGCGWSGLPHQRVKNIPASGVKNRTTKSKE